LVTGAQQLKVVNGLDKLEGALQPFGKGASSPRQRAAVSVGRLV